MIMEWKDILPWSNIIHLLIEEILVDNILKQLNKIQDTKVVQNNLDLFFDERFKVFYSQLRAEINEYEDEIIIKMKKGLKLLKDNHDIQLIGFDLS